MEAHKKPKSLFPTKRKAFLRPNVIARNEATEGANGS
jgi:hypothetical protein